MTTTTVATGFTSRIRLTRGARTSTKRFPVSAWVALGFLVLLVLSSVFAGVLAPYDPLKQNLDLRASGPSAEHWLGTDQLGRDVLSRLMYGGASAVGGVLIVLVVVVLIGVPWGLLAGYAGKAADQILMRLADAFISIPSLVFAVAIIAATGPGLRNSMIAVGVVLAPSVAILLRSSIQPIRSADYVLVAKSFGVKWWKLAIRHIIPNSMAPVVVQLCSIASLALVVQVALAFLGLSVKVPEPSWGGDLATAYRFFTSAPLSTIAPGLVVTVAAFCISRVGDGLRDKLGIS